MRRATRTEMHPVQVIMRERPTGIHEFEDFFGIRLTHGDRYQVAFDAVDATRPFLTANAAMWSFFEPVLEKRLAEIDKEATTAERVHAALFEILPSGRSTIEDVSSMLGMSKRSLQRRLSEEKTTYKDVLNNTREQLSPVITWLIHR